MPAAFPVPLRALSIAGLALAAAVSASPASAAPQVLGLVADNGLPTPLACDGFQCAAQFSTFCLQEARSSPPTGTSYVPTGGGISLVATAPDGRSVRLPATEHLSIATLIGFTSVSMSLPQTERDDLAASLGVPADKLQLAVQVGPSVSLIPVPVAGDPDPQTEDELALATGPMRMAAAKTFETRSVAGDAARLTTLLINALPARGRESSEERKALFNQVASALPNEELMPEGVDRARGLYAECRISVETSTMFSMRECLRLKHADLMARTNRNFWNEAGSS
jgi:hypothetical protein